MSGRLRLVLGAAVICLGAACATTRAQLSARAAGRDSAVPHPERNKAVGASILGEQPGSADSHTPDKPVRDSKSPARNFQKWNPIWWFGNVDDPEPPDWYRPGSPCRRPLWQLRNPLHNFTFYVIGIADRPFTRAGRFPDAVFAPDGGWNWAVARCKWVRLPFISYNGEWWRFYLGWRERGNFGGKVNFGKLPAPDLKLQAPDAIMK